ncbi:FKBP-type peptidyl-prolyl cis-trans isomerase [Streptomyces sp. NPDC001286]
MRLGVLTVSVSAFILLATSACSSAVAPHPGTHSIKVSGSFGSKPAIVTHGLPPSKLSKLVTVRGKGQPVRKDDWVDVAITSKIWGKSAAASTFDNKAGVHSEVLPLSGSGSLPSLSEQLVRERVGSRVSLVAPVRDLLGDGGHLPAGVTESDTVVTVVDILSATHVKRLGNFSDAPSTSHLYIQGRANGNPILHVPSGYSTTSGLRVRVISKGNGERVESGDSLVVNFYGYVLPSGKIFQSTWNSRAPITFRLGAHQVLTALENVLEGRAVGDRILVDVPPSLGYGTQPPPGSHLKPNAHMAFVVDVIGALTERLVR